MEISLPRIPRGYRFVKVQRGIRRHQLFLTPTGVIRYAAWGDSDGWYLIVEPEPEPEPERDWLSPRQVAEVIWKAWINYGYEHGFTELKNMEQLISVWEATGLRASYLNGDSK